MNKILKSAIAVSSVCLLVGCGNKQTETEFNPDEFIGNWVTDGPNLVVAKIATGESYAFDISWSTTVSEQTTWNYVCNYDKENKYMNCTGNKNFYVYNEDGESESEVLSENATAKFYLKDEGITWTDDLEDAGKDKVFAKENN